MIPHCDTNDTAILNVCEKSCERQYERRSPLPLKWLVVNRRRCRLNQSLEQTTGRRIGLLVSDQPGKPPGNRFAGNTAIRQIGCLSHSIEAAFQQHTALPTPLLIEGFIRQHPG